MKNKYLTEKHEQKTVDTITFHGLASVSYRFVYVSVSFILRLLIYHIRNLINHLYFQQNVSYFVVTVSIVKKYSAHKRPSTKKNTISSTQSNIFTEKRREIGFEFG